MPSTVTVTNQPNRFGPVHSPLWYRFTSPDTALDNYRFYATLQQSVTPVTGPMNFVETYKIVPQPSDNSGIFSPHKILKEYITHTVNPLSTGLEFISNMVRAYNIIPGFGYNPNLTYGVPGVSSGARRGALINPTDYPNIIVPAGFTFGSGSYYYLRIITNNTSGGHGLIVNDTITISKDIKGYNGYYDGQCTVHGEGFVSPGTSTNHNYVDVNILYSYDYNTVGSAGTVSPYISNYIESGSIVDNIRMQTQTTVIFAWDAAQQYQQQGLDWYTLYQVKPLTPTPPTYVNQHYLTDWDHSQYYKTIYQNQSETVNFMKELPGGTEDTIRVRRYNTAGTLYQVDYIPTLDISTTGPIYYAMQTGFENLFGTVVIDTALAYYDVSYGNPTYAANFWSIAARYKVVQRDCLYTNVRFCWLNKLGGYDYFNFSKENNKTTQIVRTEFQKQLAWNYSIGDRSQTVLSTDVTETYTANTDWVTDYEYKFLEGLINSADVFVIEETPWIHVGGSYVPPTLKKIPVIITDTSFQSKSYLRDKLFNMVIKYKKSHKPNIQNM